MRAISCQRVSLDVLHSPCAHAPEPRPLVSDEPRAEATEHQGGGDHHDGRALSNGAKWSNLRMPFKNLRICCTEVQTKRLAQSLVPLNLWGSHSATDLLGRECWHGKSFTPSIQANYSHERVFPMMDYELS